MGHRKSQLHARQTPSTVRSPEVERSMFNCEDTRFTEAHRGSRSELPRAFSIANDGVPCSRLADSSKRHLVLLDTAKLWTSAETMVLAWMWIRCSSSRRTAVTHRTGSRSCATACQETTAACIDGLTKARILFAKCKRPRGRTCAVTLNTAGRNARGGLLELTTQAIAQKTTWKRINTLCDAVKN